jgi:hypothetical protein
MMDFADLSEEPDKDNESHSIDFNLIEIPALSTSVENSWLSGKDSKLDSTKDITSSTPDTQATDDPEGRLSPRDGIPTPGVYAKRSSQRLSMKSDVTMQLIPDMGGGSYRPCDNDPLD